MLASSVGGVASFTSVISNVPVVKVPVLSMNIVFNCPNLSKNCDPFTTTPRLAQTVKPQTETTGVDNTSAHGHAMTSKTHAVYNDSLALSVEIKTGMTP